MLVWGGFRLVLGKFFVVWLGDRMWIRWNAHLAFDVMLIQAQLQEAQKSTPGQSSTLRSPKVDVMVVQAQLEELDDDDFEAELFTNFDDVEVVAEPLEVLGEGELLLADDC